LVGIENLRPIVVSRARQHLEGTRLGKPLLRKALRPKAVNSIAIGAAPEKIQAKREGRMA
jgi:hypothetical protein